MKKIVLSIEGMTCSACSNGLEKYLNRQEGINKAIVNLVMSTASIECNDDITMDTLSKYISDAGFKSLGIANISNEDKKISKIPYIIYGILALLLMYVSMHHMLNLPSIPFLDMMEYSINYSIFLCLLTIPFIIFGFDVIKNGLKNLIHKMPNMDTLVTIGVLSSFIYSLFGVFMVIIGHKEYVDNLYFESVAFVIYFIKLGRLLEKNTQEKTKSAIKKLVTITPLSAKIKVNGKIKNITIDEVKKEDILISSPGDKIAVDGIITKGTTHIDESFITGESKPVKKVINDQAIAGSINYDGTIEYKALKIGKDSMISEIVNLVINATNSSSPMSLLADKICSYFVPTIILIAILTLIISLTQVSFSIALGRFVSVLVVACPCALGLATPLAIVASVGTCAKKGILVRTSEILENAGKIDTIVFDKTGTLTKGVLTINKFYNYSKLKDEELLSILGSIESSSTHPIAKGIINYLNESNIKYNSIDIINIEGKGIKGTINNKTYYACNRKLVNELKIKNKYIDIEEKLESNGNSIVYVIENKKIIGLIGIKDVLRDESKKLIKKLKKQNIDVIMLSGDNYKTAEIIGKSIGIDKIIADALPIDKSNVIKKIKDDGKVVAFVGDGINDAPSIALSDIGITLSSGTDIASDSADIILINNNLLSIIDLINISKKTLINIKENLFWAFLYNILMIPIASGIFSKWITFSPMYASIAMILSSLTVSLNALRLKK